MGQPWASDVKDSDVNGAHLGPCKSGQPIAPQWAVIGLAPAHHFRESLLRAYFYFRESKTAVRMNTATGPV